MMEGKRLLIASDSFLPRWDGIASFLNVMLPKLAKKYRVTVVAPDFGELRGYENVEMVRFPVSRLRISDYNPCWPSYRKIRQLVKGADMVWTQTVGPVGMMAILAARLARKPLIAYTHSIEWELVTRSLGAKGIVRRLGRAIVKRFATFMYNRCNLLLVPSVETAELLRKAGIRTQKKVVYLGTDTERFVPSQDKRAAKEAVGLAHDSIIIGFCGRLGMEKDLVTLYRAFQRLRKYHEKVQLLVVGGGARKLEELFRNKPRVKAVGPQDNVVLYLQAMDVYVLPSLTETTSLSTLEAMACGLPVVCTPVGYIKTYIQNGINGLLVPRKNSVALYMTLRRLADDAKERERLGRNARKSVVERFSWANTLEQIESVISAFD